MPENDTIIDVIKNCQSSEKALGITSSPSDTLEITIDITESSKHTRTLGQMVYVLLEEDGINILVIGQIISVETKNRWHEDPSFKGIIKRHGKLPNLSEAADNRIANISVQSCYRIDNDVNTHILGTSPSTGEKIHKMGNDVMKALMKKYENHITYIGKVYGTDVDLPLWFRHFGKTEQDSNELGAGDAYHIGVFGRTGSGKTVTAAYTLLGYARNKNNMSILVLDPQGQFYTDQELLPGGSKLEDELKKAGYNVIKKQLNEVHLPPDRFDLFLELLVNNGFIREVFGIPTDDKIELAKESLFEYFSTRQKANGFNLNKEDKREILKQFLKRFTTLDNANEINDGFTKYINRIYAATAQKNRTVDNLKDTLDTYDKDNSQTRKWDSAIDLFINHNLQRISIDDIVEQTIYKPGNFIILDISKTDVKIENDNIQALFIKILEEKLVTKGADLYTTGGKSNCLIVMDEAHRFISRDPGDERLKELNKEIVDAVRTTRKYGIGYMFITQTIDSLDDEILRQMRIFAFGYGLTSGSEIRKVNEIVNNQAAVQLYKSFIDPSSSHRFPFMFFGPVSPLSFTGSPLFLEAYTDFSDFKDKNS